ncbi:TPA: ankyrin repeat domain-containing protein [Stenotrophomonas maltophilia]|uniref:ankyrin repeat domain-containing protein n=1 Tax=unclassified Stenotrophomonas TaxID=196198 RepID=UPI002449909D|nr:MULTISPECIES: ankyrin repeat domain-containing protein [unclassified Stenotrophomonas]HDS1363565.1 ankyrin repeat domain-containing protein [Stenotrophomonas maltophilia]MDH0186986.1 ankyrin repeat domain-containing protein [Stenotrophomonas sp. GD04051]MDH0463951.1 ankyrin repeat domain-containing protein [Stenotrophomonas sp. GD03993]MDH0874573.1 ankyrin repeat domain-containing protein [Stenotrophomonas sp. GD03877]MDH2155142.1 ankyrin repeat domain-containing protein [Stenotrophomonas s
MENYNKRGKSVLGLAVFRGNLDLLEKRLKLGVDPDSTYYKEGDLRSLVELAFKCRKMESLEILVRYGANTNIVFSCGYTMVHYCTRNDQWGLEDVLKMGVDPNTCASLSDMDYPGHAALHMAVRQRDIKTMKLLMSYGADVNLHCEYLGYTPLHAAFLFPDSETINFLLDNGADLHALDDYERMPEQIADSYYTNDAQKILSERMERKIMEQVEMKDAESAKQRRM